MKRIARWAAVPVLLGLTLAILLFFRRSKGGTTIPSNTTFFYDFANETLPPEMRLIPLIERFYDPSDGLYIDFISEGSQIPFMPYWPPFTFTIAAEMDKSSGLNGFVGLALLKAAAREGDAKYLDEAEHLARALRASYLDPQKNLYRVVKQTTVAFDTINDALVAAFFLRLSRARGSGEYLSWGIECAEAMRKQLQKDGSLACCVQDGELRPETYSHHGLVIAAWVYAHKLSGRTQFLEAAEALARYFLKKDWTGRTFTNWDSIGTDSEIALGMLDLYSVTGDPTWLTPPRAIADFYHDPHSLIDHDESGHTSDRHERHTRSVVDQAAHIVLLKQIGGLLREPRYTVWAEERWSGLRNCYVREQKMFPHGCDHRGRSLGKFGFFASMNAVVYLAQP